MANYNLGSLYNTGQTINNYSVTPWDPTDLFQFSIGSARQISLDLNVLTPSDDADLYLYRDTNGNGVLDAADTLVASSATNGNDLIDYSATLGTYFAQVYRHNRGSTGPVSYSLNLGGNYDIGDLRANIVSRNNFSVTPADPTDVFEFDISGSRQIGLYLHDITPGDDADLYLYRDSNNNGIFDSGDIQVASSTLGGNASDTIDYAGTTGTYFAQVRRFGPGSTGPVRYDLDFSTNYDIGALGASVVSRNNFNLSPADPTDVFEFAISGSRQIALNLHGISAGDDADLYLYRDSNNNGVFDSGDIQVASSTLGGNLSDTIDYSGTTGTYFAQVRRFGPGSTGPVSYDLDFSTNYDIGNLRANIVSRNNFSVTPNDPTDVFEFDISGSRQIGLYLHDISAGDDADLYLYRDSNNNGIFDSGDAQVASSILGGNASDVIDYSATTGTYFAQVRRFGPGSTGPVRYDLDFSTNYDIGTLRANVVSRNNFSVTPADPTDVFEFDIVGSRQIGLNLHGISAGDDADLYLYRDSNSNGVFDSGDAQVASSTIGSNFNDVIDYSATTGTYFAQVRRFGPGSTGPVRYDLDLSTNYDVGTLSSTPTSRNNFHLSATDPTDVFEFDLTGTRTINLSLTGITAGDDADLRLYRDNGNGVFDAGDTLVQSSLNGGNNDDIINYRGTAGTYFAEVSRFAPGSTGSVNYDLNMSATFGRASNLLAGEVVVGDITAFTPNQFGSVSSSDTTDTYAFSLGLFEGVNIELRGLTSDADLRLIRDANGNGVVDAGDVITSSTGAGSSNEQINNINLSGDYFVQVYQYSGSTNYTLDFDHFTTPFA